MSDSGMQYVGVALEDIRDELKAVHEIVALTREEMATKAELKVVAGDLKTAIAAITDQSHQLNDHEPRITKLEAA